LKDVLEGETIISCLGTHLCAQMLIIYTCWYPLHLHCLKTGTTGTEMSVLQSFGPPFNATCTRIPIFGPQEPSLASTSFIQMAITTSHLPQQSKLASKRCKVHTEIKFQLSCMLMRGNLEQTLDFCTYYSTGLCWCRSSNSKPTNIPEFAVVS